MNASRSSGILLHPTSLPGSPGIGDLGPTAFAFVDFLAEAGQTLWQILPLGPTGLGNSPYTALSCFAGNPLLISPHALSDSGWLDASDIAPEPDFPEQEVDYGRLLRWKIPLVEKAAERFLRRASGQDRRSFEAFCAEHGEWLEDFALFVTVKRHYDSAARADGGGADSAWNSGWERDIALREPAAMKRWQSANQKAISVQKAVQYFFFRQWDRVRSYAAERGVRVIGDIPIYAAMDSADVWAHRELFQLDDGGRPKAVAGVPPDYFSETGQLWGNPLYRWDAMAKNGYRWWIRRFRQVLSLVDMVRIDHFRGFEAYWAVPAGAETAQRGRWIKGPGAPFFETLRRQLGELPILAEDLGVITPEVEALRDRFGFPGMKVLQFAFDRKAAGGWNPDNPFLPHNYPARCVVYTGTHDNDTTAGWYEKRSRGEKDQVRRYLARPDNEVVWDLVRSSMASVAKMVVVPIQDLLGLASWARMNRPSVADGNWKWRLAEEALNGGLADWLREMSELYGRNQATKPKE